MLHLNVAHGSPCLFTHGSELVFRLFFVRVNVFVDYLCMPFLMVRPKPEVVRAIKWFREKMFMCFDIFDILHV